MPKIQICEVEGLSAKLEALVDRVWVLEGYIQPPEKPDELGQDPTEKFYRGDKIWIDKADKIYMIINSSVDPDGAHLVALNGGIYWCNQGHFAQDTNYNSYVSTGQLNEMIGCKSDGTAWEWGRSIIGIENVREPEEVFCDVCGRSMSYRDEDFNYIQSWTGDQSLTGVHTILRVPDGVSPGYREWAKKMFAPYEVDREYRICLACWLKALGVKPKAEGGN